MPAGLCIPVKYRYCLCTSPRKAAKKRPLRSRVQVCTVQHHTTVFLWRNTKMRYQGIIFDLDGVICHTDQYHYQAWKQIADEIGVYFDREINNRLRGVSRMQSLEIILEKAEKQYTEDEKEELEEKKNEAYKKLLQQMSPADLSEEVKSTLRELRAKGCLLAIGSSSKNTNMILGKLGLGEFFDAISDGTNITRSKPDPEVFLKAAHYLGLQPETCLVVEDALAGIEAAVAGGFDSAGIGEAATHPQVIWPLKKISFKNKMIRYLDKRWKIIYYLGTK